MSKERKSAKRLGFLGEFFFPFHSLSPRPPPPSGFSFPCFPPPSLGSPAAACCSLSSPPLGPLNSAEHQRERDKKKMDSSEQLPPPSSYPGAPRRRPSADARAAAWLSGTVASLSVLAMAVVGERERERERGEQESREGQKRGASVFLLLLSLSPLLGSSHETKRKTRKPPKTRGHAHAAEADRQGPGRAREARVDPTLSC